MSIIKNKYLFRNLLNIERCYEIISAFQDYVCFKQPQMYSKWKVSMHQISANTHKLKKKYPLWYQYIMHS